MVRAHPAVAAHPRSRCSSLLCLVYHAHRTGICTANRAGRVRLSRPQRIVVLSAQIFTSLAMGAFLFSTEPFRVTRLLQTGAMSSAVAFPLGILLPLMFRKVGSHVGPCARCSALTCADWRCCARQTISDHGRL